MSYKTSAKQVWKTIRKIKGKNSSTARYHLKVDDVLYTDKKEVVNLLADTIEKNSSSEHYSTQFQRVKVARESVGCNFSSGTEEDYNLPFSLLELKEALQKANDTAAGIDEIHYSLLTHLDECFSWCSLASL